MKYYFILILINLFFKFFCGKNDLDYVYVNKEILNNESFVSNYVLLDTLEESINAEVLDVSVGKLSRYGPDCIGCSGYLAHGEYVLDGTIYYSDLNYGQVRILAADPSYPFGSIIRVCTDNDDFLAIVLDRGGAIGFGKVALFDLLYSSEYLANIDGVSYNTTFEVLRYGF
ncbi:MAG: hypothetical protein PUC82_05740 [bacterium]|nr:hypothetical protein [bacterium]